MSYSKFSSRRLVALSFAATLTFLYAFLACRWPKSLPSSSSSTFLAKNSQPNDAYQIAVVILAAVRPLGVENLLGQLTRLRPSPTQFPIIASQHGNQTNVTRAIKEFVIGHPAIIFIHHERNEDTVPASVTDRRMRNVAHVTQHYKMALDKVFIAMGFKLAILIEDDVDIAEDFFSYFAATRHLLYTDPSIWCISAWNENGAIADRARGDHLYRTDMFPSGYGWMMKSEVWVDELSAKWPSENYWDYWLRVLDVRKERVCIRPEVSRSVHNLTVAGKRINYHIFDGFYTSAFMADKPTDFSTHDLSRLEKEKYDAELVELLRAALPVSLEQVVASNWVNSTGTEGGVAMSYRVTYGSPQDFAQLAAKFHLHGDFFIGIPRNAYYGVVQFTAANKSMVYAVHTNAKLGEEEDGRFGSGLNSRLYNHSWDEIAYEKEIRGLWNDDEFIYVD